MGKIANVADQCLGGNFYRVHDIERAISHAVALQMIHETRGHQKYPHHFENRGGAEFIPLPANCPADKDLLLYPLIHKQPYDGGGRNRNQGLERVIYYREEGEVDAHSGNPKAYFCAVVTHHMVVRGGFTKCYVSN